MKIFNLMKILKQQNVLKQRREINEERTNVLDRVNPMVVRDLTENCAQYGWSLCPTLLLLVQRIVGVVCYWILKVEVYLYHVIAERKFDCMCAAYVE